MAETSTRGAFAASFENKRLLLIQFFANPVLFLLYAAWLLIPEARGWELIVNAVLGIAIVVMAMVLHAGTLSYFCGRFRNEGTLLKPAFARALRNIIAVVVWMVVFYLVWRLWGKLDQYQDSMTTYFRSMLPASLRRHLTLRAVIRIFEIKMFIFRWIITPGILLPFLARAADRGFSGFGTAGWTALKSAITSVRYWVIIILAAVVGVHVSGHLLHRQLHSEDTTFAGETASMVLRFFLAYLFALFSWMLTCSVVGSRCGIRDDSGGNSTP